MNTDPNKIMKLIDGDSVPRHVIKTVRDAVRRVQADNVHNMLPVLALDELAQHAAEPRHELSSGYGMYLHDYALWPLTPDKRAVLRNALVGEGSSVTWRNPLYTEGPTFRASIIGIKSRPAPVVSEALAKVMHRRPTRRKKTRRPRL